MKRKRKKDKSILLRLFILLICGYFTITLAGLWGTLNENIAELESLEQQLATEQNEVKQLRAMLEAEDDTPIIEKAARDRLGYIYSDEQVFIDISGD